MEGLPALAVLRKTGKEQIHINGLPVGVSLLQFWQWSASDLVNNALRRMLAEFIVACDLGVADGTRVEWAAYDLQTHTGIKVEVKSAAYLQSWQQARPSPISFDIRPTLGWDAAMNEYTTERKRHSDVYVFCLLKHLDKPTLDPLDVAQWQFYVLSARVLNASVSAQRRISLATLLKLNPEAVMFGAIRTTIEKLFNVG